MTQETSARNIVNILLANGVDFGAIKKEISEMMQYARQTNDFENNYDLYKVVIPLYKASIALESVSKNPNLVEDDLLSAHIINIINTESVFERMLDRVTDKTVGAKILSLLSQIIPVALLNELGGHVSDEDLGISPSKSEVSGGTVNKETWDGR